MTLPITGRTHELAVRQWVRGFWAYYREYTSSAIHTASAAALAIFGLLIFIDPLFAGLAIVSYVGPPVVLYSIGTDVGTSSDGSPRSTTDDERNGDSKPSPTDSDGDSDSGSDTDSDGRDSDSDSDGRDGDSDSDR